MQTNPLRQILVQRLSNSHWTSQPVWASGNDPEYDIFYKRSTNGGGTWTTKRLTWITGASKMPVIAVAPNNNIYVVWQDENPGNFDIYFKKGIQ